MTYTYTPTTDENGTWRLDATDDNEPFLVFYPEFAAHYNSTGGNYAYAIFKVVRTMCNRYIEKRPRNGDKVGMAVYEARLKAMYETLEFWEQQAGVQDAPLSSGYIDTALDATDPALEADA
jgi:hypothetical protein